MKTRTLLLLSVVCGSLILLAGVVFAVQLSSGGKSPEILHVGENALVGDMNVAVLSVVNPGKSGSTDVQISMVGVQGQSGIEGWRLLGQGKLWKPLVDLSKGSCSAQTLTSATTSLICVLRFPAVETIQGVAYSRGGEQSQWIP